MAKIFIIGSTGHIGGAVLDLVYRTYPDATITLLVRDDSKASRLIAKYPRVTAIIGDLESPETLESACQVADVVINAAPDVGHENGIAAILRGLKGGDAKKYYIQTSGAALIWDKPDGSIAGTKVWDDIEDIDEITSMPEETTHRTADKMVFAEAPNINVAVISPVAVYGLSPSLEHPLPLTLPDLMKAIQSGSSGFTISTGKNISGYIHVMDLARLYLLLLAHAIDSEVSSKGHVIWGSKAYYFGVGEELSFLDFMTPIVRILIKKGILETEEIKQVDVDEIAKGNGAWSMHVAIMFGVNMRVRSSHGQSLGWLPKEVGVRESLEDVIGRYLDGERANG